MLYYTERLIKDNPDHQYCQSMYNIAKYLFKEDDVKIDFTNLNIMEDFELQPIVIKYASERIKLSINPSTISEIKLSDVRKEVLIKSILNYFRDEYFYIKDIGDTIRLGVETMLLIEPVFRLLTNTISRYEVKKYKKKGIDNNKQIQQGYFLFCDISITGEESEYDIDYKKRSKLDILNLVESWYDIDKFKFILNLYFLAINYGLWLKD